MFVSFWYTLEVTDYHRSLLDERTMAVACRCTIVEGEDVRYDVYLCGHIQGVILVRSWERHLKQNRSFADKTVV